LLIRRSGDVEHTRGTKGTPKRLQVASGFLGQYTTDMKRILARLVIALALIVQGTVAVASVVPVHTANRPCCPHHADASSGTSHAECPCPIKQACAADCAVLCSAGDSVNAPALNVAPIVAGNDSDDLQRPSLQPRSDTPPIRPPIA
jgi:hypothetical protein